MITTARGCAWAYRIRNSSGSCFLCLVMETARVVFQKVDVDLLFLRTQLVLSSLCPSGSVLCFMGFVWSFDVACCKSGGNLKWGSN